MSKPKSSPPVEQADSGPSVFRDKRFRSRTLVLPDGGIARVEQGQVKVTSAVLLEYLNKHPDFEPLE